jgi:hypothetical protein
MRNLLKHPDYPDIVGEWARQKAEAETFGSANDNEGSAEVPGDPLLTMLARMDVEATRLW